MRIEHVRHGDPRVANARNVNQAGPFGKELSLARKVMVKGVMYDLVHIPTVDRFNGRDRFLLCA